MPHWETSSIKQRRKMIRVAVSILLGWLGFYINLNPIVFQALPPHHLRFLLGQSLPLLLSMLWGWRYGLISATLGLAGLYSFVIYAENGWSLLAYFPFHIFWFVWHGYWAKRFDEEGFWYHSLYVVELPFSLAYTLMLLFIVPILTQFNPPFWNPQATETSIDYPVLIRIAVKTTINNYVLLAMVDILRHFHWVRAIFETKDQSKYLTQPSKFIGYSLLAGFIAWFMDGILEYIFFNTAKLDFLTTLLAPSLHSLFARFLFLITCLLIGVYSTRTIHKQMQIEKELAESRRKLTLFLQAAHEALIELNLIQHQAFFSPRFYQMLGYTSKEIPALLESWLDLLHPEDKDFFLRELDCLKPQDNKPISIELRLKRKDNIWCWVLFRGQCMSWTEQGKALLLMGTINDISDSRLMEERLRQSEKLEAIGQLAGGITHDFNNQLAVIQGYTEILLRKVSDPTLVKTINSILMACQRATGLTQQLLSFSRRKRSPKTPVDIHSIIQEVCPLLEHSLDKKIIIQQTLSATQHTLLGDATQIQNALLNLALNARDAMPEGGTLHFKTENITLTPTLIKSLALNRNAGAFLCISVSDTGIGMSEETQKHLFEPFFTTKAKGKGTGLGLASVYGTIRNHHGAIQVESKLKEGTCFKIYFHHTETQDEITPLLEIQDLPTLKAPPSNLMVIDDEDTIRKLVGEILEMAGHQVIYCKDGSEAVEWFQKSTKKIDLVILDMIMPNLNGRETFIALKKMQPTLKVLISSGYSINDDIQYLLSKGAFGYIQKPFRADDLLRRVNGILTTQKKK